MTHRRGSMRWFCLLPAPHPEARIVDCRMMQWLASRIVLYAEKRTACIGEQGVWMMREREVAAVLKLVRQFRTAMGMTHEQREAASAVPHGSIASIDSGIAEDVHASMVIGFAKALQASAGYVLGLDKSEEATSHNQRESPKRTRHERRLLVSAPVRGWTRIGNDNIICSLLA
jgi:hypothetical protein